ncbi:HsdR family type I site-specific deoxyribonuclease [uncultured Methanoregula sp.]|uniref:type I restriction endonuclease subunit R n=1 Tax=uncultured Methanoregula sp. TaxID=1005933 RepID=UPI002AAAB90A|nr:HsdR family type I site-specific deoxyribonuclease [uncultured Methanoregula sp.]
MKSLEAILVETPLIEKLQANSWTLTASDKLERESYREPLLINPLIRAIKKINKDICIGEKEIWLAIRELQSRGTGIENARQILQFMKNGIPVRFEKTRTVEYIRLFDYDTLENNEFVVSRQVIHEGGTGQIIRNDILLYINGIPLVNIECKDPASLAENWHTAYAQIKKYEDTVPELYKYVQIGMAAEQIVKFFPIVPWQDEVKTDEWKIEGMEPHVAAVAMLQPECLLDILRFFLFMRRDMGEDTKVLPRYIQYRAANKIVSRVLDNLAGRTTKNRGLIWHWQGSGKTLTMIFAANKLYHQPVMENPSIFFIVDRIDLEDQLYEEYTALTIKPPEIIGSIAELKRVLLADQARGRRGIMITLIHKFRPEELHGLQKELEKLSGENVTTRKNIVAFIDEGHRSQYGLMATQMRDGIFKNGFFFALTGTPVSRIGKDTYSEFSYPEDGELYLDRYFIRESIDDGFTVKIAYQPRLEKEADIHLNRELLQAFLETELEEIPDIYRQPVEEGVKKRLNIIKVYLENPKRIEKIAKDIAAHFRENVDGRYKAMVVAVSRRACSLYKQELDKLLPPEYSKVVMTYQMDERDSLIASYKDGVMEANPGYSTEEINNRIREQFKDEENPRILIVTDKLLTGFDAPILQTMYLDKPLKAHRLLQAIARTNRPYKGVKEAGLIIDYVGVLTDIKKALEKYNETDITSALFSTEEIVQDFVVLIDELARMFIGIEIGSYDKTTFLSAIELLTGDESVADDFVDTYREMRRTFEFLGPDKIKLAYFEQYKWFSEIYAYYIRMALRNQPDYATYVQKYFEKTVKYVHKTTDIQMVENNLPVIEFGPEYLRILEEKVADKREKAANIVFTLNRFILVDRHQTPVYESLLERVEKIIRAWKEKSKDYEAIYRDGAAIIQEMQQLNARRIHLGFSELEYSMFLKIEKFWGDDPDLLGDIHGLSEDLKKSMFPGWISQVSAKKGIEQDIRRFTRRYGKQRGKTVEEIDQLYLQLIESVKNYAGSS